jgi:hypothetical protein
MTKKMVLAHSVVNNKNSTIELFPWNFAEEDLISGRFDDAQRPVWPE